MTASEILNKYKSEVVEIKDKPVEKKVEPGTDVLSEGISNTGVTELTLKQFAKHFDALTPTGDVDFKLREKLNYIIQQTKGEISKVHGLEDRIGRASAGIDGIYKYIKLARQYEQITGEMNAIEDNSGKQQQEVVRNATGNVD